MITMRLEYPPEREILLGEVYIRRRIAPEEKEAAGHDGWAAVHVGIGGGRLLVITEEGDCYVNENWVWEHNPSEWERIA